VDIIKILSCGWNCVGGADGVVARGDAGADEITVIHEWDRESVRRRLMRDVRYRERYVTVEHYQQQLIDLNCALVRNVQ